MLLKLPDDAVNVHEEGKIMSHPFSNTESRSFKVHYRQYLIHKDEPEEINNYDGASAELDASLIKSSFDEKRRLRRAARRLRRYAV